MNAKARLSGDFWLEERKGKEREGKERSEDA